MYFVLSPRTVEDFDDWTNWLLYKGGVGVKGDNSWESWWDEEQVSSNLPVFQLYVLALSGLFLSLTTMRIIVYTGAYPDIQRTYS